MRRKRLELDLKTALKIGFILYLCTFVLGIFWVFLLEMQPDHWLFGQSSFWIPGALSSILLACFGTFWYFRFTKLSPSAKAGLLFGIISLLLGFLLDFLLLLPLVLGDKQEVGSIFMYYSSPLFSFTLFLVLVVSGGTGFALSTYPKLVKR